MPVLNVRGSSSTTSGATAVADPGAASLTAPVRNRYFYGKMLDVRHLEMEQAYFIEHRRRLNRLAVGFGVVCGLEVTVGADDKAICVAPGFAIDGRGREIVVTEPICVADPSQLTDDCGRPAGTAKEAGVTLCLAYHECDTDPSPVLVDDCDVREGCAAGAVRERYRLLVHDGVPDTLPYGDIPVVCRLLAERLATFTGPRVPGDVTHVRPSFFASHETHDPGATTALLSCAPPAEACVVLATVTLPEGDAHPAPVPDTTHRRTVLSNDRLFEAILCLAAAVERCCARRQNTIEVLSGNDQEGKTDQPLPEAVGVIVKDPDGQPVEGETVTFTVTSALGGSFEPAQEPTASDGVVKTKWVVGKPGPQTAVAALAGDGAEAPLTATAKD